MGGRVGFLWYSTKIEATDPESCCVARHLCDAPSSFVARYARGPKRKERQKGVAYNTPCLDESLIRVGNGIALYHAGWLSMP
eukprot:scaffold1982_cov93-Amphora_coffeaeformis.AAC.10